MKRRMPINTRKRAPRRAKSPLNNFPWWKRGLVLIGAGFLVLVLYSLIFLPSVSNNEELIFAESTVIYDRGALEPGADLTQHVLYTIHGDENREFIPLEEISPWVAKATIAIEDDGFYSHMGFDIGGIIKAALNKIFGIGSARGGSTITQQLVKNTFLSSEKTITRKFKEILLSIKMEIVFSKDEILELYLNKIPYGHNAHGIEAAARKFFGKSSRDLTIAEAAILASLPARPTYFSPYGANRNMLMGFYEFDENTSQNEYKKGRKDLVLQRMLDEEVITFEQFQEAFTEAKEIQFTANRTDIRAPHFVFRVRQMLEDKFGKEFLSNGGLQVFTSLDPELQQIAEDAIELKTPHYAKTYGAQNVALASINPSTGEILAYVGGKDYFNSEIDGQVDVLGSTRQPGSSFKPLVYASAFEAGYAPSSIIFDVETDFGGNYKPQNFDGEFAGPVSARESVNRSLNIPAVKMAYVATPKKIFENAQKLGIQIEGSAEHHGIAIGIGVGEVEPLSHINSYQTFVNGGPWFEPTAILEIRNSEGKVLEKAKFSDNLHDGLDPEAAALVRNILTDETTRPTTGGEEDEEEAFDWNRYLQLNELDNAAKTGTSNRQVDNPDFDRSKPENEETNPRKIIAPGDSWTIGFTPQLVTGVWVGNNRGEPMKPGATGLTVAAPVWREYMLNAHELLKTERNINIDESLYPEVELQKRKINKLTGRLASDVTPTELVVEALFASYATPIDIDKTKVVKNRYGVENSKSVLDLTSIKPDMPNWEEPVQEWLREHPRFLSSNGLIRDTSEGLDLTDFITRDPNRQGPQSSRSIQQNNTRSDNPKVAFITPRDNGTISAGRLAVNIEANSKFGIEKVDLYFDDQLITTDKLYPYEKTINIPSSIPQGSTHILEAVATDRGGLQGVAQIEVTVEPDTTGPEIVFIGPVPQERIPINARLDVLVDVKDFQSRVRVVEFLLDGASLNTLQNPPYRHTIQTIGEVGKHDLTIRAWDENGNMNERSIPIYYEREKMIITSDPEITDVKNYRKSASVNLSVPKPEDVEYIMLQAVKDSNIIFEEKITSPAKFTQLQIEKNTTGKVRLELWTKTHDKKITRTSQKTVEF